MVRVSDGLLESFGGTFSIRVPFESEIGCCFNPALAAQFFRKDRKAVSYTLKDKKLRMKCGKETLSIRCLPPEDMVTLNVLAKTTPATLDTALLKHCVDVVDPAHSRLQCQGVSFRNGMAEASDGKAIVSFVTDFDEAFEFNLPVASAKAMLRFKAKVVGMAQDMQAVKFIFDDGSELVSRVIPEQLIETRPFYEGEWNSLNLHKGIVDEILSLDCDFITFKGGNLIYEIGDNKGTIEDAYKAKDLAVKLSKARTDVLLKISEDIRLEAHCSRVMAVSDMCRAISTVWVPD